MPTSVVQAAKAGIKSAEYEAYAASQINYMLGDNPNNFSYVIGYGDSFPKQPHHKVSTSVKKFFFGISFLRLLLVPPLLHSAPGEPSATLGRTTLTS